MRLPFNYNRQSEYDAYAPIRIAFDITPSTNPLAINTRAIMVSVECAVTGVFVEDIEDSNYTPHTTLTLSAGILYPFAFKKITAVSASATVKGYA